MAEYFSTAHVYIRVISMPDCIVYLGSERIHVEDNRPVSCWEEGAKLFCVAPNLVCTDIYQTAGGGDNISGAGLSLQIK